VGASESGKRCVFPTLSAVFVSIILVTAFLMTNVPASAHIATPLLGAVVATTAFGAVVELQRRKLNSCPWLDFGASQRITMYVLLFVVGLAVVFPGVWPSHNVEWPLRVPFALLLLAGIALLRIHRTVDHGELEETGVSRALYLASRSPLYFLGAFAAFVVVGAVLSFIGVWR
jgi:hypothetical protein